MSLGSFEIYACLRGVYVMDPAFWHYVFARWPSKDSEFLICLVSSPFSAPWHALQFHFNYTTAVAYCSAHFECFECKLVAGKR